MGRAVQGNSWSDRGRQNWEEHHYSPLRTSTSVEVREKGGRGGGEERGLREEVGGGGGEGGGRERIGREREEGKEGKSDREREGGKERGRKSDLYICTVMYMYMMYIYRCTCATAYKACSSNHLPLPRRFQ